VKEGKMKMLIAQDRSTEKGFTLMELLIVIVIIGILAVAVLAALNPLEQIRRANDSGKKANARELVSAIDRYVASQGALPTRVDTDSGGSPSTELVDQLITAKELKTGALGSVTWDPFTLTKHADDSVSVCFDPESDKFQADADTNGYNADGTTGCSSDCYVCVPE